MYTLVALLRTSNIHRFKILPSQKNSKFKSLEFIPIMITFHLHFSLLALSKDNLYRNLPIEIEVYQSEDKL